MTSLIQRPVIWLVEDSDDDAFFFMRALRLSGFSCELIHLVDGGDAVRHLAKAAEGGPDAPPVPDLVFLDLKIPTLSGFEVLQWVRQHEYSPAIDIAVLSGSEHAGDVDRAVALGATAYYVKPILVQQVKARFVAWHEMRATRSVEELHAAAAPDRRA